MRRNCIGIYKLMVYDKAVCEDDHANDSHEKGCNEKREKRVVH